MYVTLTLHTYGPTATWAQALRRSRADSGGELAFSPIWQAIDEATRTRLTGDNSAPSWASSTHATEVLTRVDPAPPATSADIEDLSFWLANQFVSSAFEVFYYHFRALCRARRPSVTIESLFLSFTSNAINTLTLTALLKEENTLVESKIHLTNAEEKARKTRMKKTWSLHQEPKLRTMVAHLNFIFKSEKFEACNVNNLYQVSTSSNTP